MATTPILTVWHNNIGRPIYCPGLSNGYAGRGGISPYTPDTPEAVEQFVQTMGRYGATILTDNRNDRPFNHNVCGVGGGHNDADWCESRFEEGSHAAWLENTASRWNDTVEVIVRRAEKGDQ